MTTARSAPCRSAHRPRPPRWSCGGRLRRPSAPSCALSCGHTPLAHLGEGRRPRNSRAVVEARRTHTSRPPPCLPPARPQPRMLRGRRLPVAVAVAHWTRITPPTRVQLTPTTAVPPPVPTSSHADRRRRRRRRRRCSRRRRGSARPRAAPRRRCFGAARRPARGAPTAPQRPRPRLAWSLSRPSNPNPNPNPRLSLSLA